MKNSSKNKEKVLREDIIFLIGNMVGLLFASILVGLYIQGIIHSFALCCLPLLSSPLSLLFIFIACKYFGYRLMDDGQDMKMPDKK